MPYDAGMASFCRKHTLKGGRILTIREATESDAEEIIAHCEQVGGETDFLTYSRGEFGITVDEERVFLREYPLKGNVMMLSLVDDQLAAVSDVGRASLRDRLMHIGSIGISVQKSFWRLGVASHTVLALIDWSKEAGLRKLNLEVSVQNKGAIALYEKLGFIGEGQNRRAFRLGDTFVDSLWMGLIL